MAVDSGLLVTVDPSRAQVTLVGELDRRHSPQLLLALPTLAGTSDRVWLVDAAQVTFCDAGGVRALAAAAVVAEEHGCDLRIVNGSRCVRRLVTIVGLDHLLGPPLPAEVAPAGVES